MALKYARFGNAFCELAFEERQDIRGPSTPLPVVKLPSSALRMTEERFGWSALNFTTHETRRIGVNHESKRAKLLPPSTKNIAN